MNSSVDSDWRTRRPDLSLERGQIPHQHVFGQALRDGRLPLVIESGHRRETTSFGSDKKISDEHSSSHDQSRMIAQAKSASPYNRLNR